MLAGIAPSKGRKNMKIERVTMILRSLLGFIFVAGPLASALNLVPEPAAPPAAAAFVAALGATGYMLPLLWSTEIAAGVLLLSGLMVPFALTLLAPVIVNIAAFHVFLAPNGYPPALVVIALELFLVWR
jgi:putative oxidoreductase